MHCGGAREEEMNYTKPETMTQKKNTNFYVCDLVDTLKHPNGKCTIGRVTSK